MTHEPGSRPAIYRNAALFLVTFVLAMVLNHFSETRQEDLEKQFEKAASILETRERKVEALLQEILRTKEQPDTFREIHRKIPRDLWEKEGTAIFVYYDDSLVYWSGYDVPASNSYPAEALQKPFIRYGNGWYRVMQAQDERLDAVGLILVKKDYPYQNEYLVNDFRKEYNLPPDLVPDTVPGTLNYFSGQGQFIFSLTPGVDHREMQGGGLLSFALFATAFVFLVLLLWHLYHAFAFLRNRPLLLLTGFIIDAVLVRVIMLAFNFPGFLYDSTLFSPYLYAASFYAPSLGDLVLNSLLWLLLASFAYRSLKYYETSKSKWLKIVVPVISFAAITLLFHRMLTTVSSLVNDSSLELNLNNIFNTDLYSLLAFFAITCLLLALFLFTSRLITLSCQAGTRARTIVLLVLLSAATLFLLRYRGGFEWLEMAYPGFLMAFLFSLVYFLKTGNNYRTVSGTLLFIVIFAMTVTFVLDVEHEKKEKSRRQTLANALSSKRDPLMEYEFLKLQENIRGDTTILGLLEARTAERPVDDEILKRLNSLYFGSFWNKYEKVVTICRNTDILRIQPSGYLANCFGYFMEYASVRKAQNISPGLFFLNYSAENNNYLAVFEFVSRQPGPADTTRIFVELYYKYVTETGMGYPDLLIDRKADVVTGLADYSYARYVNGELIYKFGDYDYMLGFSAYESADGPVYFLDQGGYNHYVLAYDDINKLIISKKSPTFLDLVAPFSYLVIFFGVFLFVFLLLFLLPNRFGQLEYNFSNQLQVSIILIIIVSFIVLGMITRANIIHLYDSKNRDNLNEKTLSVLTELEHKIGGEAEIRPDMYNYLHELLYKFSLVFFSDINLYDLQGNLIATSRPQIFDEELISGKMNTEAFYKLAYERHLLYVQDEKIGNQQYLSAYIPLRNNTDNIIAYLNLPYFAKQTELRKEIGDFLAAYINVYVLLIVLAILVTVIVSRLVTRPLKLVAEKLGKIGLGKANEKIEWRRKDEIGKLVEEYNRMIDELARSAELLASSERESAWREMARQVAHEIKNPLTPMKLSVQHLQKAWDEKSPNFEGRMERFTRTIIEQIDALSEIASEFSDFAKMPAASLQKIELTGVIRAATGLYQHHENIKWIIDHPAGRAEVRADQRQLLRVFNNLIQNAIQAIGQKEDGRIRISVRKTDQHYVVDIADNGTGITEEQARKIFSPSFTTKTSGMGLGLAMVKNLMTTMGGDVGFVSTAGEGATFTLRIPVHEEPDQDMSRISAR